MIYFCADDYGMSEMTDRRIEKCLKDGALNKVSVLVNSGNTDFKQRLSELGGELSLHLNLVEGKPLSEDVPLLTDKDGNFRYSFIGLLLLSLSPKRREMEKQIGREIKSQLCLWRELIGDGKILIDSHQHTHMIPLIFKVLMKTIKDEGIEVDYLRIPDEPLLPYIASPSLYSCYSPAGFVKQWLLKFFAFINKKEIKKSKIPTAHFMGVMLSGHLTEKSVKKLLSQYQRYGNNDIEVCFHPGYADSDEEFLWGRKDFKKFYYSPWRRVEFDSVMNLKDERRI